MVRSLERQENKKSNSVCVQLAFMIVLPHYIATTSPRKPISRRTYKVPRASKQKVHTRIAQSPCAWKAEDEPVLAACERCSQGSIGFSTSGSCQFWSMHSTLSVCLSLSACLSVFVFPPVCLSVGLSACLCLSIRPSICLAADQSIHPPISFSMQQPMYPSICVHLYISLPVR